MERKTLTTLGELRIGDRFVYPGKTEAWQVTARADKSNKVAINQFDEGSRKQKHRYDDLKKASTRVMFLRHTVPAPGEDCMIVDMTVGDIFFRKDNVIQEYELTKKGHDWAWVRRIDSSANTEVTHLYTTVTFVRHKNQALA